MLKLLYHSLTLTQLVQEVFDFPVENSNSSGVYLKIKECVTRGCLIFLINIVTISCPQNPEKRKPPSPPFQIKERKFPVFLSSWTSSLFSRAFPFFILCKVVGLRRCSKSSQFRSRYP